MLIKTRIGQYRLPTENPASDLTIIYEMLDLVDGNVSDLKKYLHAKVQVGSSEDDFWEGASSAEKPAIKEGGVGSCEDSAAGIRERLHNHYKVAYVITYSKNLRSKNVVTVDQLMKEHPYDTSESLYNRLVDDPYTELVAITDIHLDNNNVVDGVFGGVDCIGYGIEGTNLYVYYPSLQQATSLISDGSDDGFNTDYDYERIFKVGGVHHGE